MVPGVPSLRTQVELLFGGRCKRPPQGVQFAPGRVIALGGHLEAHGGPVLAAPLELGVACAWGIRPDSRVVVWSMNARQKDSFHQDQIFKSGRRWSDLARGAFAHVAGDRRRMPGVDLMVLGDLPAGEGLASSAAYLIAILRSLYEAIDVYRSRWELAEDVPAIEAEWLDQAGGRLDPYIVAAAKPGQLLHVDSRELDHDILSLADGYSLQAEDSGVSSKPAETPAVERAREIAAACEELRTARPALGGPALREPCDLEPEALEALAGSLGETSRRRLHYLVTETARVRSAVAALTAPESEDAPPEARMKRLGRLMVESHRSLAQDLEISTPEIDSLVDLAISKPSILGGRLQGPGGGGRVAVLQRDPTG